MEKREQTSKRMIFRESPQDLPFDSKLGGQPFGFPANRWPASPNTGDLMTFLGYFSIGTDRSFLFMSPSWDDNGVMHVETYDPAMGEVALVSIPNTDLVLSQQTEGPILDQIYSIDFEEQNDLFDSEFGPLPEENSKLGGTAAFIQEEVHFGEGCQFLMQLNSEDTGYKPLDNFVGDGILYVFLRPDGSGTGTWQCT